MAYDNICDVLNYIFDEVQKDGRYAYILIPGKSYEFNIRNLLANGAREFCKKKLYHYLNTHNVGPLTELELLELIEGE